MLSAPPTVLAQIRNAPPLSALISPLIVEESIATETPRLTVIEPETWAPEMHVADWLMLRLWFCSPVIVVAQVTLMLAVAEPGSKKVPPGENVPAGPRYA